MANESSPAERVDLNLILAKYAAIPERVELFEFAQDAIMNNPVLFERWKCDLETYRSWKSSQYHKDSDEVVREYPEVVARLELLTNIALEEGYITRKNAEDLRKTAEGVLFDIWYPQN